jgi:hypothetical protein
LLTINQCLPFFGAAKLKQVPASHLIADLIIQKVYQVETGRRVQAQDGAARRNGAPLA